MDYGDKKQPTKSFSVIFEIRGGSYWSSVYTNKQCYYMIIL